MIKKQLELIINTGQAESALQGVDKSVNRIDKDLTKTEQEFSKINTDAKQLDSNLKKVPKATKKITGGFRAMGTALKAAGIGLVISGFALLKELFQENQKVVDVFNIAFESLSIAFNDFFNYISKNVETISGYFNKIFNDPLESVKALGRAIKDNIIERVQSLFDAFGHLGKTMKKLFSGDWDGALEEIKKAGSEMVDVMTGVDNSVEKITEVVSEGVTALTEYTKSTVKQATANVELKKTAELASVANQGLIEKYDLLAESQRQIRDDERKSIDERIAANNELGIILEKQQAAMLENAQISLRAARAELKKDKDNIEFKKAVMEAENELAAVRAQVAGFRSEQQTNEAALEKEGLELINSKLESEANLSIQQKRFNAEQIENELERLQVLKNIDAEEKDLQLKRLQGVIDAANAGTQAKVDAEIAYNETKQQLEQQEVLRAKEIADAKAVISKQITDDELANDEKQKQSDKDKAQQKIDNQNAILDATNSALSSIGQIADAFAGDDEERAKKAFNINKGLGIAQAIISTSQGIMNAYTNPLDVASGVAFAKSIAIGLAGAAQIATIATTQFKPSGGGGSTAPTTNTEGGAATSPSQAPSFNVVGQSGFNQVAGALGQQQPVQAFVVSGDVTTAQQLQNNTIQQATF